MALGKGLGSLIPPKDFTTSAGSSSTTGAVSSERSARQTVDAGKSADKSEFMRIPLTAISPNPEQPRRHFTEEELNDLAASIKVHGVMQPIMVSELGNGRYELIAGERRWRASTLAGLSMIPAVIKNAPAQDKLELALIENIQRANLNPIEEAFAYERLIKIYGLTQEQAAARVGKSRSTVANTIRLLSLPEEVRRALMNGTLTMGKARALLSLPSEKDQLEVFRSLMGESVSTRQVEDVTRQVSKKSGKGSGRRDPNLSAIENSLQEKFGTKVKISERAGAGSISLYFSDSEDLKELLKNLGVKIDL